MKATRKQKKMRDRIAKDIMVEQAQKKKDPDDYVRSYVERFILPHVHEGEKDGQEGTQG